MLKMGRTKLLMTALSALAFSAAVGQGGKAPPMAGAYPRMQSTGWDVVNIYKKGATPPARDKFSRMIFCKGAHWEMFSRSSGQTGTYSVDGNQLTITVGSGPATAYTMTWKADANVLQLESSTTTMWLEYSGEPDCK